MTHTIGFIGLGMMGKPMAANLLKAGYRVMAAYHRNKSPAEELQALGATIFPTIKEMARHVNLVITVVPADYELLQVYTGEEGLLNHLAPGSICIDMTSALPDTIVYISNLAKERSIRVLDGPVSGGPTGAEKGKLTIMIGGDPAAISECRPVLEVLGERIFETGEVGSGKAVKMINQLLNAGNTYIAAEAMYLAQKMDLDMDVLCRVVDESSGGSYVFRNTVRNAIIPESFESGFKLDLMKKDIALSIGEAKQLGIRLPLIEEIFSIYCDISNQGYGEKHYGVVSKWVKQQNARNAKP